MTLIVAAISADYAIQVSDRRLSVDGKAQEVEATKATIFSCLNARFSVGYTGLARYGRFETAVWLRKVLRECAAPDYLAQPMTARLLKRATHDFRTLSELRDCPRRDKRLTLMFTGFVSVRNQSRAATFFLTNYQDYESGLDDVEAWNDFRCLYENAVDVDGVDPPTVIQRIGVHTAFPQAQAEEIRPLLAARKPPAAVVGKLIELMHLAADQPSSGATVGKNLISVVLPANYALAASSNYHPNAASTVSHLADIVIAMPQIKLSASKLQVQSTTPGAPLLSVPKQQRNARCACGSGKKYKMCHGKVT